MLIPRVRFTKLIIYHLKPKHNIHPRTGSPLHYSHKEYVLNTLRFVGKDGREIFGMPIPNALLTDAIKGAPFYSGYLEHVTEYQRYLDAQRMGKRRKPKSPLKLVDEFADEGVPVKESVYNEEEVNLHQALDLSLKELEKKTQGLARPMVFRKPDSGRFQPLPETPKKKSPADQFIFQRHTPMSTESFRNAKSPSIDAELTMTDSVTKSDKEVAEINVGDQDEGQAGLNPGGHNEGQAESNLVMLQNEEFTTTACPNVKENLKLPTQDQVILEEPASSTRTLSSLQNLNKELSFTNQFFVEKPQEESLRKPILNQSLHNFSCSTPNINSNNHSSHDNNNSSTTTTSTITKHRRSDLIATHWSRLYNLENLNIPYQVRKAVDEIVTDAVDWVMQALLRACFSDLPTVDMKEFSKNEYLEAARLKKRKRRNLPRTPFGSPSSHLPPPSPPAGAFGAPGTSRASRSSQLPPPPPHPSNDSMLNDDSIPDEHVQLFNDEDIKNDQLPKADMRKDWWKPLPKEERPTTPKPAWTILSSNMSDVENNWAIALSSTYATPAENSLLAKTRYITTFMNCPPGHVTIQTQFFFNKDLEYLWYENKGSSPALLISKMKVTRYPNFGLELLVPEQLWIDDVEDFQLEIESYQTQLNVTKPGRDAKGYEFKHDYTIIESPRVVIFPVNNNARKIIRFNKIYKFSDGTLTRIPKALDYRVKEFKIKRLNLDFFKERNDIVIPFKRSISYVLYCKLCILFSSVATSQRDLPRDNPLVSVEVLRYPTDFGKKKSGQNFKKQNVANNNNVGKSSSSAFSDKQMATLLSLIKDNKIGKNVQANMVGANQHMTYIANGLDNVIDISHLKIKVGYMKNYHHYSSFELVDLNQTISYQMELDCHLRQSSTKWHVPIVDFFSKPVEKDRQ
nr:hypothetical protein [Tanacetum cinerariifolium]